MTFYSSFQMSVLPELSCELARICLRQTDDVEDDESDAGADNSFDGLTDTVAGRFQEMELYELDPSEQLDVLSALSYRVINTYNVQMHMEEAFKKVSEVREKVKQKKKENQAPKKAGKDAGKSEPGAGEVKKEEAANGDAPPAAEEKSVEDEIPEEFLSRASRRKRALEQNKKEEELRREKQREEAEKQRKQQEIENADKQLNQTRAMAKRVLRHQPLGTDRHHYMYWLFHGDSCPGLYIEKGWAHDSMHYCTMDEPAETSLIASPKKKAHVVIDGESSTNGETLPEPPKTPSKAGKTPGTPKKGKAPGTPSKKAVPNMAVSEITRPVVGLNLWCAVESTDQFKDLMGALNTKGIRESKLIDNLKNHNDEIVKSIRKRVDLYKENNTTTVNRSTRHRILDGHELHLSKAREYLCQIVDDCNRGCLLDMDEPDVVSQRVKTLETPAEFSSMLLEVHAAFDSKYLRKYMTGVSDSKGAKQQQEKQQTGEGEEGGQQQPDATDRAKVLAERRTAKWVQAVKDATLLSRFNFLTSILYDTIRWDLYSYKRKSSRRPTRKKYNDDSDGEEEEEEMEVEEDSRAARMRKRQQQKEEDIIQQQVEEIEEEEEESGRRRSSRRSAAKKKPDAAPARRSRKKEESSADEEDSDEEEGEEEEEGSEEEEEEEESEEEERPRRGGRRKATAKKEVRRSGRARRKKVLSSEEEESEDDEEAEEDDSAAEDDDDEVENESSEEEIEEEEEEEEESESSICRSILEKLMKFQYSDYFQLPVDIEDVPDYYTIIAKPISMSEILTKIDKAESLGDPSQEYTFEMFVNDFKLLLNNAAQYNVEDSPVVKDAKKLEQGFLRFCRKNFTQSHQKKLLETAFLGTFCYS